MIRISYNTTGMSNQDISRIFDIMANISVDNKATRSIFDRSVIEAIVEAEDDARFAESEIELAIR